MQVYSVLGCIRRAGNITGGWSAPLDLESKTIYMGGRGKNKSSSWGLGWPYGSERGTVGTGPARQAGLELWVSAQESSGAWSLSSCWKKPSGKTLGNRHMLEVQQSSHGTPEFLQGRGKGASGKVG